MKHAFRSLVIDLLDDPHGIDQDKFHALVTFADRNYPHMCDDVFSATDGAEDRVYLDEDTAEELRDVKELKLGNTTITDDNDRNNQAELNR
jgi:hypothetical protein